MKGLAITDHGNMFGVFDFVAQASKIKKERGVDIKPIIGCEFYLVADRHKKQFTREEKDVRYHQLLLAKNEEGYKNLSRLCSLGYIEGLYGKYPRIDKELILNNHKGLIATTCCMGAEVPKTILRKGEAEAEKVFRWWLEIFGEDYYIELQRHYMPEQEIINNVLLKFAEKYGVKTIATNDSHYVDRPDADAHDILLCVNTGEQKSTPKLTEFSDDDIQIKGKRFAFFNDEFYFKTTAEMQQVFADHQEAVANTEEVFEKIDTLKLEKEILLPFYKIPPGFTDQDEYLRHLTYEGAKTRYEVMTPEIEERLNFELFTIKSMGFAGYFLIVSDFCSSARDMGVFVGPGRGSAAGSAVAYCTGITNIDPIKYQLLFERFLNPERKSMPDIDTDFDDDGRQKVINYVVEKYGRNQVAQIITFQTMAARSSIKDVARVLDLPLADSNILAKLVPEKPGTSLKHILGGALKLEKNVLDKQDKEDYRSDEIENVKKLRELYAGDDLRAEVLKKAEELEGSVRGSGIHAAGIIIAPNDLLDIIPVSTSKESELFITQFEGNIIESAGVIKMDFLGLKTLSILKDALRLIYENHKIKIELDTIPLDDEKTFLLYQRGETNATFQFESIGMQKYLRELKPDKLEDLIAMNALFRPGPMEYIPNFIKRKHGIEEISYDLPEMEEYLHDTYGITVYQEQVMLLSQKLAGFTKGDADTLRKAMGKKQIEVLDKMQTKFMEGAKANAHPEDKLKKIWEDWKAFAQYAFNKSHATCYAVLAYQTAYLKANYPAEYMAAVLTHSLGKTDKITYFIEECKRMGIPVQGPDVNESFMNFSVNDKGIIRFGLAGIKGVGESPSQAIIDERKENGSFTSIFDLTSRLSSRVISKRVLESLAYAGAFDCFEGIHRAQYVVVPENEKDTLLEKAVTYGLKMQENKNSSQASLFGFSSTGEQKAENWEPKVHPVEPWPDLIRLNHEKEYLGFYLSAHPMDGFKLEIESFTTNTLDKLEGMLRKSEANGNLIGKEVKIAGLVTKGRESITRKGKKFKEFTVEDWTGSFDFVLFNEQFLKFKHLTELNELLIVSGILDQSYRDEQMLEFKIKEIKSMEEYLGSMEYELNLTLGMAQITKGLLDDLEEELIKHGNQKEGKSVIFHIADGAGNQVSLLSRSVKVTLNEPLKTWIHKNNIGIFLNKHKVKWEQTQFS